MELELKHLAPYLPYELKIYMEDLRYHGKPFYWELGKTTNIKDVLENKNKPILRPLSDLTKEIYHNAEKFVPIDRIKKRMLKDIKYIDKDSVQSIHFSKGNVCIISINYEVVGECPLEFYNSLVGWHFDVFGLIEAGLAIDLNTINK
jgi:hypothetical protein